MTYSFKQSGSYLRESGRQMVHFYESACFVKVGYFRSSESLAGNGFRPRDSSAKSFLRRLVILEASIQTQRHAYFVSVWRCDRLKRLAYSPAVMPRTRRNVRRMASGV